MTPVERVAAEIRNELTLSVDFGEFNPDDYRRAARAAIEALRPASEKMVEAMVRDALCDIETVVAVGAMTRTEADCKIAEGRALAVTVFDAAIDAALAEKEEG